MGDKRGEGDKRRSPDDTTEAAMSTARDRLTKLCECERVVSCEEILAHGRINRRVAEADGNASSSDEVDEILEAEYRRLNDVLGLPVDTYSLTRISPNLPTCVKYGVRSGLTNQSMQKFSPLSRGLQGPAVAIAAFATTALVKARCWNELIIDQIVDDGDTYYCESYERRKTDDRRTLTVLDLNRDLVVQKTHRVHVKIDEPLYAGTFRSKNPTNLHLVKALELFFKRHDAGVLTSPVLNIAVWKDAKYFNIFDGQGRRDNLLPTDDPSSGAAKLILVPDLTGVVFVIHEKSAVDNENFVIYGLSVMGIDRLPLVEDDPEEPQKSIGAPKRRPSGYKLQNKFRAVVQGSFHLNHALVPEELRGHAHLVVALAALIYSRLVNANKWTTAMIDLIFNQAHIYLIDLARVLEKKLDENFELKIDDVMGDVILGVYAAKIKVEINVVPGQAKKGKATIDTGVRDFFKIMSSGILEIKKKFYAVWRDGEKYYFLDPFACDDEGFRVDPADPESVERYDKALACVTMNSSINELIETILENTGNKEKDAFVLHGLRVLYVSTGSLPGGPLETVIYREKKTNRRPLPPRAAPPEAIDDCKTVLDMIPRPRPDAERTKDASAQYPELMRRVEEYMMKENEPTTFVETESDAGVDSKKASAKEDDTDDAEDSGEDESAEQRIVQDPEAGQKLHVTIQEDRNVEIEDVDDVSVPPEEEPPEPAETPVEQTESLAEARVNFINGYNIVNPHRMILHGSKNCLADEFDERARGRQGVVLALTAMAYAKIKDPTSWRNLDVDQILRVGDRAHSDVVTWIRQGSPATEDSVGGSALSETDEDNEAGEDDEEDEDEDADDEEGEPGESKALKGALKRAPSHLDLSMLPGKIKLAENEVTFKRRSSVVEGDADPLANLGEALEQYFGNYSEVILENKRLAYGIWRQDDKYFLLNPYGADEEGWRLRDYPASLVVTDTINELTDLLHGVLEFNDTAFNLHFIGIEAVQPQNKYIAPQPVQVPEGDGAGKYRTRFLPVTDEDLFVPRLESESQVETTVEEAPKGETDGEEDTDEEGGADDEEEPPGTDEDDAEDKETEEESPEPERQLEDPLLEVDEQERPDAPEELNLSLLTGSVKIDEEAVADPEAKETLLYERLKYSHPPPYVLPPKRVLCVLLEAKKASKSVHSLVSRFSIDSKLAVKAATDLPTGKAADETAIASVVSGDEEKPSKMIKLPPKKYLFSRIPPTGFTPLRAINDKFIQDEELDRAREDECRKMKAEGLPEEFALRRVPEEPVGVRITPEIIPLGPTIKTPTPRKRPKPCADRPKNRKCRLSAAEREDSVLRRILCNTEDVLFDVIFPNGGKRLVVSEGADTNEKESAAEEGQGLDTSGLRTSPQKTSRNEETIPETVGFVETEGNVGIIEGNMCLKNRGQTEDCHFRACFFAGILCILAKVRLDVDNFRGSILDQFVLASEKILRRTGRLRYKPLRWFHNIVMAGVKCNVIMKQSVYADPESCETDALTPMLETYLSDNKTGILVFANASYAFWSANGKYYMFDPYACDGKGRASDDGAACLLEFCELEDMTNRLRKNNGTPPEHPYRIYSLSIAHMEAMKGRKTSRRKRKRCSKKISEESVREEPLDEGEESDEASRPKHESSLMEIPEWVTEDESSADKFDPTLPGFAAVKNLEASALEVAVVENDITRPILAPFRKLKGAKEKTRDSRDPLDPPRRKPFDRKFGEQTCLGEPIDLCVIAWSLVKDPTVWGLRTIRGIYEAARDLALDSLLAARDSTVVEMTDGLLTEFSIGNYSFRAVFAPLRGGKLYAMEGWNLAMSLKKILEVPIYSGAILVCGKAHIGLMKRGANHYAWWAVPRTKNLRIVTSEILEDFLKLVVRAIGEREEREFVLRIVTISYARKLDPDCSDMVGLHEAAVPSTSLAQIHRKSSPPYDLDAIFRPSVPNEKPLFVSGTVALNNRDGVTEPRVKRCYFVALLSVMVKRDIIQSPMPGMIDKVIEVAENLYREFEAPKYHTEHILRNVTVMNRIFDFRDCASTLHLLKENPHTGKTDFYAVVRKELRRHLKDHTDGIIHFTNCCYGFWYSRSTRACYYVDPYPCDSRGRRVGSGGNACLCIFPSICQMARHMCLNRLEETTGFFIHRLHVESINVPPFEKFHEDPMWVYLDYHWSFDHSPGVAESASKKAKRRRTKRVVDEDDHRLCEESEKDRVCPALEREEPPRKPSWNYYAIEVPNLIYSVWGTLGCYDSRFGDRAGRNQAAICVAILAMQYLCHPSRWGAVILDSAVMCGDSYYTESLKSASRRGSRYPNRFNLQACFRVFPHVWSIEFCASMCGVLYGGRGRPNLATALKLAVEESPSLVVECGKVTVAVLSAEDGFYIADPCWTGPPLFAKNHGAVYALRCRNINSLVYAITKIFNTNQRLEFRIDPVTFSFSQEICKFADARGKSTKKILVDALGNEPGFAAGPDTPLSGAVAVPDAGGYLSYRRNVGRGILHGGELEDPPIPSPVPWMEEDNVNNSLLSTTWHLNVGKAVPKRRSVLPFEPSSIEHYSKECPGSKMNAREPRKTHSISDKIQLCDEYPRTIDLAAGRYVAKSTKILTRRKPPAAIASTKPLECRPRRSFLLDSSRKEFRKWNKRMADEAYKTYRHRAILEPEEETDVESQPADEAGDGDKTGDHETFPDDQAVIDEGND